MWQQHFIIDGKHIASCQRSAVSWMGTLAAPASFVFVCPACGDAWAKAMIEGSPVVVFMRPCPKHTADGSILSGSLWMPLEQAFTQSLCGEVLLREFLLHLNYAESLLCQTPLQPTL